MTAIVPIDLLDPGELSRAQAWVEVHNAAERHLYGAAASVWGLGEILEFHRQPDTRRVSWAAIEDDVIVGAAEIVEGLRDNLDSARIWISVLPQRRGRGIGGALVEVVESAGRRDGRTIFQTFTGAPPGQCDPSRRFAERRGYAASQTELRSGLSLPLDTGRLTALVDIAEPGGDPTAYRIESHDGMPPDEWLAGLALLNRRMSTEAPMGALDLEEEDWDEQRVRRREQSALDAGRRVQSSVAREAGSGRLVGFTQLAVSAETPTLAYQGATLVLREHRGHRIGMRLKAANVRALQAGLPEVSSIRTWNAEENEPMLAVNRELGFVVDSVDTAWQKKV